MRTTAQICLIVSALLFACFTFIPFINIAMLIVQPVLLLPVAWWFLFNRHLEPDREELFLRLDAIANAIRESERNRQPDLSLHR